ncbi:MAG: hypothetical protein IJ475_01865 [Bacilli bacterium]|nr:hypothetical protein [Bacilli bacterium]
MQKYNNRSEVPLEYKWDLTPFFKDDKEFDGACEKARSYINDLRCFVGCTKDPIKLYDFLKNQIEAVALIEDIYVYSFLVDDQELGLASSAEKKNKAEQLDTLYSTSVSFFAPELLKLSEHEYDKLFETNPKLEEFKSDLDRTYREKNHILTENEESIVAQLVNSMNHYEEMSSNLLNSEHDYGKVKLDDGTVAVIATNNYRSLMRNKNVNIRKKVYKQFNKKLEQYADSCALYLNSYVSMNNTLSKIRHYKDSWSSKLFELNFSDKIFKTLVKVCEDNYFTVHKYYDLKRRALGLDVLNRYDTSLEMAKSDKEYSILDAQNLVRESLKPLGDEYINKYNKIIDNRYIDYCQYKGKCSGGYCASTILQDSRILLSFNGNLDSVSTIAHEAGHCVHHQFINENNPMQYRMVSSMVGEVVSLTNECLLSSYLAEHGSSKEEKLAGIANILGVITSNLFDAAREGKMEQDMYNHVSKGGVLTKEFLGKKAKSSLKKLYGNAVKSDKYMSNTWITRSHYYMHFYLYAYAICISVATNVASKILDGDKEMLENYYKFMKLGSDKWPTEAFKVLGVDLEDASVYENAIRYYDNLIDKYNQILNENEVK